MAATTKSQPENVQPRHNVALWAALTALFTNLAAVNLLALFGAHAAPVYAQLIAAVVTAIFVAATVYTKQRWTEEKTASRKRT
jgi:predicted transporter